MTKNKYPLSVIILACVYVAVGAAGFVYHSRPVLASHAIHSDDIWIELTELLAVVCGAFLLRGHNWARWLAVAWIAFHVVLSAFNSFSELAIHCLFCAVIAWLLFRPKATQYFRRGRVNRA